MTRPLSAAIALSVLTGTAALGAGCQRAEVAFSDGALRNATANGAAAELGSLGYRLRHRLSCRTPAGNTRRVVRVHCEGTAAGDRPVRVDGVARDAETRHPRQEFVIVVDGHEVVRKSCLGLGCRDRP